MGLQERNLSMNAQGADVALLHNELRQLGLIIVDAEATAQSFGASTHASVQLFQKQHGLAPTGVVDAQTATAINTEVDKIKAARAVAPAAAPVVPSTPPVATRPNPPPAPAAPASGPAGTSGTPVPTHTPATPPVETTPPVEVMVVSAPSPVQPPSSSTRPPTTPPPIPAPTFTVRGQIRHSGGAAIANIAVQAFDLDLRSRQELGSTVTDASGKYLIRYNAAQFQLAEKGSADLVVQVSDSTGKVLASSPIMFNAPADAVIDLTISGDQYRGPSEYEQLVAQIRPLLPGGISLSDLVEDETHQDISFLAGETGENPERIGFLSVASRLAVKTGQPSEVFYAFFRQGLPTDLPFLLVQGPSVLRGALEASLNGNLIPQEFAAKIADILNALLQLVGQHVLRAGDGQQSATSLGGLLGTTGLSDKHQETFLQTYIQHEGPIEDFWKSLGQTELKDKVSGLQLALQLGLLTQNNVPLVKAIKARDANLRSPRDLARISEHDWKDLIGGSDEIVSAIEPLGQNETREDQVTRYAGGIIDVLRSTFPTAFVGAALDKDPQVDMTLVRRVLARNPGLQPGEPLASDIDWDGLSLSEQTQAKTSLEALRQELNMFPGLKWNDGTSTNLQNPLRKDVVQILSNFPELELRDDSIDRLIASAGDRAFAGVRDKEAATDQIKRFQRVLRVAPRHDHMAALMTEGLDSARVISNFSEASFVDQFAPALGGADQARVYHNNARRRTDMVTSVTTNVHQSLNDTTLFVLDYPSSESVKTRPGSSDPLKVPPNFTTLFGSYSLCECGECRSVYSPAAYFVDVLHFLDPGPKGKKALTPLLARRPDLEFIPLTCENTNTEMPYVDLVNEILEFYVAHGLLTKDAARDTVNITAEELSANPQYTIDEAYAALQTAVYPPTLPFHRPLEVARLYLEHLGSSRYQVMKTFQKKGVPTDTDCACEYLKISSAERQILTGDNPQPLREFYGYGSDKLDFVDMNGKTVMETWQANVSRVPEFLRRTGTTYAELLQLLDSSFLNPNHAMTLTEQGKDPQCDLDQTKINNLDDSILQKAHRFIRLAHKLQWPVPDLDKTISAMQAADITPEFLEKLAALSELKSELNISFGPLLSLWADIETKGVDPLYPRLFLNKAVLNPPDTEFELDHLKTSTATLSEKNAVIMAALSIGSDDLSAIRDAAGLNDIPPAPGQSVTQPTISLANLSQLYRFVVLARTLKLKTVDFLSLRFLIGIDPFQAGNPAPTLEFVKKVNKVKRSGFSVAQLNYLFRPLSNSGDQLAPRAESVDRLTQVLQDGLRNIIAETTLEPDPTGEIFRLKLAMVLDATLIDKAMAVIDDPGSVADSNEFIQQNFTTFLDPATAASTLSDPSVQDPEVRKQANRAYVAAHLMGYLRDSLSRGFIKQTLSGDLKLDSAMVELLLETIVGSRTDPDPAQHAISDFLALMGDGLTAIYYDDPTLSNPQPARTDPVINFDWSNGGSPDPQTIPPSTYSAKWSGKVLPRYHEDYTFYLRTGGGVRLTIDGQTHIDDWTEPAGVTEYSIVLPMQPGVLHDIEVQFFKSSGQGVIEFRWSSASTPKEIVPQTQLYSSTHFSLDLLMDSYRLLCKIALLINQFKINLKEVAWLSNHPGDFSAFDFNALPMTAADFSPKFFDRWERLFDLFNFRGSLPQRDVGLTDVFGAASRDEAISRLKIATGWNNDEVDTLAGAVGFDLQLSDFSNEVNLLLMQECLALSARLSVSCGDLFGWVKDEPTPERARDVVNAAKAKYEPEQWLTVAKPLMDVLRGSQKAALIAYILASDTIASMGITDSNQLFEFFLIDVDMGTCMMTSRIKQAISSVQLFIQRCLMNLEPKVSSSQIDADQWEWMKNYRIWEANRKVFLYPENWIEPELRDDKSPFFRELETQLLQNDVTKEAVEDAFLAYLQKLDEIAKLEVCGFYHQLEPLEKEDQTQTNVLHVFARTPNPPHVYYYRQLNAGTWTPWEKVNVDIEGDHLIPIVYNRRLYIFWPHFEQKPDESQQLNVPYIQSAEHWRWVNNHTTWRTNYDNHQQWLASQLHAAAELTKNAIEIILKENGWPQFDADNPPPQSVVDALKLSEAYNAYAKDQAVLKADPAATDPGPEPAEPAYSTPPSLTHWEIKLAWSEYTQGKWTAKQTSSEFVTSSLVQRSLEEAAKVVTKDLAGLGTNETTTTIFLPERETHFFRTTILDPESSDLMIDVYRRYEHAYNILDVGADRFSDFRHLGRFRLYCGAKVSAVDLSLSWEQPSPLPDHTINQFMAFQHQGNTENLTFTAGGKLQPILKTIPQTAGEYSLVPGHQYNSFSLKAPFQQFFYQDKERAYYVAEKTEASKALLNADKAALSGKSGAYLKFDNFFHPFVCEFISTLSHQGIAGMLDLGMQKKDNVTFNWFFAQTKFYSAYKPSDIVDPDYPQENVDFEHGAYALYNWELFFHIPMLIATSLSNNQQFEDAQAWFHYIFNPTKVSASPVPQRYWNTLPFFNNNHPEKERIQQLLEALDSTDKATQALRDKVKQEIQEWRDNPFNPHLIARMRITAYQKNVVMKYIDNLIAWGDQLFSRDTIESINEATLLYVLAHSILGPKPEVIPSHTEIAPQTYFQLKTKLDDFSNALVVFENQLPYVASAAEVA